MNTGQMMLTICGLVLLSTLVLNMNRNYNLANTGIARNKFDINAIEIATAYLESIKNSKKIAFDEKTIGTYLSDANSLSTIGKDAGESRTSYTSNTFDDVDDFNNDTTSITLYSGVDTSKVSYFLKGQVQYFDPSTSNVTSTKKFHKKVTVNLVSNSISSDTLKLSTIISYWEFK